MEIKTSTLFELVFARNIILSSIFFLIIDLYFLITVDIAQIFNFTAETIIPIGIPTKKAKA